MIIYLGGNLKLENPPLELVENLKRLTTGPNPAYSSHQMLVRAKPRLRYAPVPDEEIKFWYWENSMFCVPVGLLDEVVKYPHTIIDLRVKPPANFKLNIKLRDYQVESILNLTNYETGILEASTGSGKTIMAMGVAEVLQTKTLFLVHTKNLLHQTCDEVKSKLGIIPGIIGDGKKEIKDFTVATIQTLIRDSSSIKDKFGLVLVDETQHVPCNSFAKVVQSINSTYKYGLSATPYRTDGLTWVIKDLVGPTRWVVDREALKNAGTIISPTIKRIDTKYIPTKQFDPFDLSAHLSDVCNKDERNDLIIDTFIKNFSGKRSVILTERVEHCCYLADRLKKYSPVIYHGELGNKERKLAYDSIKLGTSLTIATYSSLSEGFDVPSWEELYLATPFSSSIRTTQVLGRISRASGGKTSATVYDFVDIFDSVLYSRFLKREKVYAML